MSDIEPDAARDQLKAQLARANLRIARLLEQRAQDEAELRAVNADLNAALERERDREQHVPRAVLANLIAGVRKCDSDSCRKPATGFTALGKDGKWNSATCDDHSDGGVLLLHDRTAMNAAVAALVEHDAPRVLDEVMLDAVKRNRGAVELKEELKRTVRRCAGCGGPIKHSLCSLGAIWCRRCRTSTCGTAERQP